MNQHKSHPSKLLRRSPAALFFLLSLTFLTTGCDALKNLFSPQAESKTKKSSPAASTTQSPGTPKSQPMAANALARVGSWSITKEEFEERLKALKTVVPDLDVDNSQARELVLQELVNQQLLVEEAETTGLAADKDIKAAVEEFRRSLIVQEAARKLVEGIDVTESEAREFYDQQKDQLVEPIEWHIREIQLGSELKAKEVLVEILNGADFSEMAKKHSTSDSASKGGDLGFVREVAVSQVANAVLLLNEGEVSSIIKASEGFYIVKLEEKKGGEQIAFDDIKEDILENRKINKQQQAILEHLNKLKEQITVNINRDLL